MIHHGDITSLKALEEILSTGVDTIKGDLWLKKQNIKDISHLSKYNYFVDGIVNIDGNKLGNLIGLPKSCNELNCSNMKSLVSLEGAPNSMIIDCSYTSIVNFKGIKPNNPALKPLHINSSYCKKLISLNGLPKGFTSLNVQSCTSLKDLIDLPDHLIGDIDLSSCGLKSLSFLIGKNIEGSLLCYGNEFGGVNRISKGIYSWEGKEYFFKKKFTIDRVNEIFIANPNNLNASDFKLHLNILRKFLGSAKEIKPVDENTVEIGNKKFKKNGIGLK